MDEIVLPITFGVLGFITLIVWIVGFAVTKEQKRMVWIVLGTSCICSLLGAWAVCKYGVVQDQIYKFKVQNQEYEGML